MKFNTFVKDIDIIEIIGTKRPNITGITIDTRKIDDTINVYIAKRGYTDDGNKYIENAINLGCNIIVCEPQRDEINKIHYNSHKRDNITFIVVKNLLKALNKLASNFYENPSFKLKLIGITGTNGKTSTANLLYQIFKNLGYKVGLISTVNIIINDQIFPNIQTTPDIITINSLLHEMILQNCKYCFMEVSSHAIHQNRVGNLLFTGKIFLNISSDHLDYHGCMKNYIKSKKAFFSPKYDIVNIISNISKKEDSNPFLTKGYTFALYNEDDPNGHIMVQNSNCKLKSFSLKKFSDFNAKILSCTLEGMDIEINNTTIYTKFIGDFNAYNILAAYSCAIMLDQKPLPVKIAITKSRPPKGRFNIKKSNISPYFIIDYAHTSDALKKILSTIHKIKNKNASLITVIGCGGNRDKLKRPIMGNIAIFYSNKCIFTSDNPRYEKSEYIIQDMISEINESEKKKIIVIINREKAIKYAAQIANKNDIIVIAGKGHENFQEINGIKYDLDDMLIVDKILSK